jgi:formate dehydrogenase (coenzyme F420) beta subunit
MEYWALATHGDPIGTLRELVKQIWSDADLEGMIVNVNRDENENMLPRYTTEISLIDEINPFKPLMEINTAKLIPNILSQNPGVRLGVILRPCEMRALIEMTKHTPIPLENLITISVDCLGTLVADEYHWRLERLEKSHIADRVNQSEPEEDLAEEALTFARQGGIIPYRYRSACQVCNSPEAEHAHINIHILGLPARQQMLLSIKDAGLADLLSLDKLTVGLADEDLIAQHTRIVSKMLERHARTLERVNQGLGSLLPADVDAVIRQLEGCGECQACMEACPICSVDRPYQNADGHYERTSVMHWLVSCAGCGMCEQSCPSQLPTAAIFTHIRQQLAQEWDYVPGRSHDEPLPVT